MKRHPPHRIRNVALVSHGGVGKTSLAEAMLFTSGLTDRQGRVEDGNTVMDWDPEEVRRGISISLSVAPLTWGEHKINLLDTPGFFDFAGEVKAALRVVEAALILVDAVGGVEVGTELVWQYAEASGVPRIVVINKMDRDNASFEKTLASLQEAFGRQVVPLQVPLGAEGDFKGVIDLVEMRALVTKGREVSEESVPGHLMPAVEALRDQVVEAAAEADDELTLKYLEGEPLTTDEIRRGLKAAIRSGQVVPVLCTAGARNVAIATLLDAIVELVPSPADTQSWPAQDGKGNGEVQIKAAEEGPLTALVFKTMADPFVGKMTLFRVYSGVLRGDSIVYNVSRGRSERLGSLHTLRGKTQETVAELGPGDIGMVAKLQATGTNDTLGDESRPALLPGIDFPSPVYSVAVFPKSKGDEEKIGSGLARLVEEDPTFAVERNPVTAETIVSGLGDLHVDVMVDRLKRKFNVDATTSTPKVAHKETIKGTAKAEYKHKKQSGGRGQYGHVVLELQALPEKDFEFADKIFAGSVPQQYRPAVEKGVRETMAEGVLAGYPVSNVRATLLDGSYHDVDSSEMAFKLAAAMAFKKAFAAARPVLLEPVMLVDVYVPDAFMGDIIGDLNKKRGRILGMEPAGEGRQVVRAQVPQAEMFRYALDLRSITQGRGTFNMSFDHYDEVPANIAEAIIAANQRQAVAE